MFGTMCKPLHAGMAARNGQYAALLAKRGFSARPDGVECSQGFADTQSPVTAIDGVLDDFGERFHTRDMLFKYHAACYGTHASIEALSRLRDAHDIDIDDVARIEIRVPTRNLKVCNLPEPRTGLEAKFSLRQVSAMALAGETTADIARFNDGVCAEPRLAGLRHKTQVTGDADLARGTSDVIVSMKDGVVYRQFGDVSVPSKDLDNQGRRLESKFITLASPVIGNEKALEIVALVQKLEQLDSLDALLQRCH